MMVNGFTINQGDIIKIVGEHGKKFRFLNLVHNPKNGATWVDCIQLEKGVSCGWRSFYPDRVKRIPVRRKRVKRNRASQTS